MMFLALLQSAVPAGAQPIPEAPIPGLPAAPDAGLDYLQLILHASIPVQLVIALLLLASIASWAIIFRKHKVFTDANFTGSIVDYRSTTG